MDRSGYAALSGAATPDYIIPTNFFNPSGDTLQFGSTGFDGIVDTTTFAAMPADSSQSLNRLGASGNTFTITSASPTHFAGATGAVPEPTSLGLLATGALLPPGASLDRWDVLPLYIRDAYR